MVSETVMPDEVVKTAIGKDWAERRTVQAATDSVARAKISGKHCLQ